MGNSDREAISWLAYSDVSLQNQGAAKRIGLSVSHGVVWLSRDRRRGGGLLLAPVFIIRLMARCIAALLQSRGGKMAYP